MPAELDRRGKRTASGTMKFLKPAFKNRLKF
jgi:hypothetical protein